MRGSLIEKVDAYIGYHEYVGRGGSDIVIRVSKAEMTQMRSNDFNGKFKIHNAKSGNYSTLNTLKKKISKFPCEAYFIFSTKKKEEHPQKVKVVISKVEHDGSEIIGFILGGTTNEI